MATYFRTTVFSPLPDMSADPVGEAILIAPADRKRKRVIVQPTGLVFVGESKAQVEAFATTGALAMTSTNGGFPIPIHTTGEVWCAAYGDAITVRVLVETETKA